MLPESRLIGYTASDFLDPKKKVDATVNAPITFNSRAAEKNSLLQNANAATKGIREGSNPNADFVENNVKLNFQVPGSWGPNELTPEQYASHLEAMRLAQATAPSQTTVNANPLKDFQTLANANKNGNPVTYDAKTGQTSEQSNLQFGNQLTQKLADPKTNISMNPRAISSAKLPDISNTKGYIKVTSTDENGNTTESYQVDPNATAVAQQEELKRREIQRQNDLTQLDMQNREKDKIAKFDTSTFDQAKTKLDELDALVKTLSPELQSATAYELSVLRNQMTQTEATAKDLIGTFQTDQQIQDTYQPMVDFATRTDQQFKDLADRNLETMQQVATYNRDMLEIDKKIMEQKAAEDEAKQIKANIQNEKKLRRQLNALGIQTDVQGLDFLNDSIQEGQDALASLRTANSLNSLKANLAIGEGYRLDVQKALDAHEAAYLEITTKTQERLASVTNSIAQAKSERAKGIRETLKWGAEQKNALELETAKLITEATYKTMEAKEKQDQRDWEREKYQMEKDGKNTISELQSLEWTSKFSDIITNKASVKEYDIVNRKLAQMEIAYNSGRNGDEALLVLWEKILDPTSVVKEGEFARVADQQGYGSSLYEKLKREARAFASGEGGQPIPEATRNAIINLARDFEQAAQDQALEDIRPTLLQVSNFNRMKGVQQPIDIRSLPFLNQISHPEAELNDIFEPVFSNQPQAAQTSLQDLPPNGSVADTNVLTGNVWYGSNYWDAGLDISAPHGTPITMPVQGEVVAVTDKFTEGFPNNPTKGKAQNGGWGNQVKIKTQDGLTIQFSHLSSSSVKPGDIVSPGQMIAAVGNTGNTYGVTGNHLDLTIYGEDGKPWTAKKVAAYIGARSKGSAHIASQPNMSQLPMSPLHS